MKKRIIICCDGTWQDLKTDYPTNIVKVAQSVRPTATDGTPQVVYYDGGVGSTEAGLRLTGGAFGWGLDKAIMEAYAFLCLNWEQGDEIYLVGFSRGAYTVRSVAGLMRNSGLVKRQFMRKIPDAYSLYRDREVAPEDQETISFRNMFSEEARVTALCCFDTVGSLGVPDQIPFLPFDNWINAKYQFHDIQLSRIVDHAYHAVSIDEPRKVFSPALMEKSPHHPGQTLRQIWFVGDHGCVGGGSVQQSPLSNITLGWLAVALRQDGLGLDLDFRVVPGGVQGDALHPFKADGGLLSLPGTIVREFTGQFEDIHPSVIKRWQGLPKYRPKNLTQYKTKLCDATI
jgi:uncharacterized protein (DUF2235 family)